MKRRGIVLELEDEQAIVLTPDGDFRRIPQVGHMEVGMEVTWGDGVLDKWAVKGFGRTRSRTSLRWRPLASGAAAAIVVAAGVWMYAGVMHPQTAQAYAWVSLDVNPSLSLKVDKNFRVRQATGTDADGKALVSTLHLDGLTLSQATAQVLAYSSSHHFLTPQSGILVAVSPISKNAKGNGISTAAEDAVKKAIQSDQTVQSMHPSVFAVLVPPAIWQAAYDAHISPGRLMSVLVAAQEGKKTGLLDVQGQEIVQVWSNPIAQQAALEIGSNNANDLTRVLQSLADPTSGTQTQPGTGKQNSNANSNSHANHGHNTAKSGNASTASGTSANTVTITVGQAGAQGNNSASGGGPDNQNGNSGSTGRGPQGNNVNNTQDNGKKNHGGNGGAASQAASAFNKAANDFSNAINGPGQSGDNQSGGNPHQDAGNTKATGSDKTRGNGRGRHSGGRSNHSKNGKGNLQNTITIHIGDRTFTIPLQMPGDNESQSDQGDGGDN